MSSDDDVVIAVRDFFYGGSAAAEQRRAMLALIEGDPVFNVAHYFNQSHHDFQRSAMAMIQRLALISRRRPESLGAEPPLAAGLQQLSDEQLAVLLRCLEELDGGISMRHGTHTLLFRQAVKLQGTAEQWAEWGPRIESWSVIGCFAMTELGHSSALGHLETTASYDAASDEFVLSSPTVTATKWWIGGAGHTATHAVVIAQLLLLPDSAASHGLAWFIVPLRLPDRDGAFAPGVECGELGPKPGRQGVDNGWIRFSGARVPRSNMLMRWQRVDRQGQYTPPAHPALPYLSLIPERFELVAGLVSPVLRGVTIAVRYAFRRRQSSGPLPEQPIVDYASHYAQLMPVVAHCYVFRLANRLFADDWHAAADSDPDALLPRIADFHAVAAGLKAWIGWWSADSLETCRRSMGGHAYSLYNNIYQLIGDLGVLTTGGGDNAALCGQAARLLLRQMRDGSHASTSTTAYFHRCPADDDDRIGVDDRQLVDDLAVQIALLERLAVLLLRERALQPADDPPSEYDLWDGCRVHTFGVCLKAFAAQTPPSPPALVERLQQIGNLAALSFLDRDARLLLETGVLSPRQVKLVRKTLRQRCADFRAVALQLVDAFDLPDFVLRSPLAARDGSRIYENYFAVVKNAPGATGLPSYWHTYIAPLTKSRL